MKSKSAVLVLGLAIVGAAVGAPRQRVTEEVGGERAVEFPHAGSISESANSRTFPSWMTIGDDPACSSQCHGGAADGIRGLPQPSRGDQDRLEVHDERPALLVDGRADGFEQTVSDCWFQGGVIAP